MYVFVKNKMGISRIINEKNTRFADFCADQIDVITNFAVITNVVIKRVHCRRKSFKQLKPRGQNAQIISPNSVNHLNIDNSAIFDTQTWIPKQRCDQVPAGSKHHLAIIIHIYVSME